MDDDIGRYRDMSLILWWERFTHAYDDGWDGRGGWHTRVLHGCECNEMLLVIIDPGEVSTQGREVHCTDYV